MIYQHFKIEKFNCYDKIHIGNAEPSKYPQKSEISAESSKMKILRNKHMNFKCNLTLDSHYVI